MVTRLQPELIADVLRLWADGFSGTEVARMLGLISRNVVIGIVHRHGDPKATRRITKAKPARRVRAERLPVAVHLAPAMLAHVTAPPIALGAVSFLESGPGQCRFPLWSSTGVTPLEAKMVCGKPAVDLTSYCPVHSRLCWNPPRAGIARPAAVQQ